jgi:hypothetical protein
MFLTSIAQGFVWMRSDRRVVGVFLVTIYFNIFGWPCSSMIPVIGTDYMRLDPSGVGMMASADARLQKWLEMRFQSGINRAERRVA